VPLLFKLGQAFEIDLEEFAEDEDARVAAELSEVFGDQLFENQAVRQREARDLVAAAPNAAQATVTLYHAYRRLWEQVQALGCEIRDAKHLVYADGIDPKRLNHATEVGVGCRVCDRLAVEEHLKHAAPFPLPGEPPGPE
jgi:hypothetical protein